MNRDTFDWKKVSRDIEKFVKKRTEEVIFDVQEALHEVDFPVWTGLYRSGWDVMVNHAPMMSQLPDGQYALAMSIQIGKCESSGPIYPEFQSYEVTLPSAYAVAYIANVYPHAPMIEHEGTKCHPEPWKTAASARDMVLRDRGRRKTGGAGGSLAAKFAQGGRFASDAANHESGLY